MLSRTWRGGWRGLVVATGAYLVHAAVATWVAMLNDIPGRPFGVGTGLPIAWDFAFGLGTGLSAPLAVLVALAVLAVSVARNQSRRSIAAIGFLGWCFLLGMLVEPIIWDVIRGEHEPLVTGIVIANLMIPIVILGLAIRIAREVGARANRVPARCGSG